MKFASYWHETSIPFEKARKDPVSGKFDVAVIGAGFTGLNAARKLAKEGVKVALLEAVHIGYGASGRNGGHLNNGLAGTFPAARSHLGEERATRLYQAVDKSIEMIEQIIVEEGIECNFRRSGKIKLASKASHVAGLRANYEAIHDGVDRETEWLSREDLSREIQSDVFHAGLLYKKSAMMHMGRYANGMAEAANRHGAAIWEHSPVTKREKVSGGWKLVTPNGSLMASQVILATDAYTTKAFPYFRRRIIPVASFLIATRPLSEREIAMSVPGNRTYVASLNIPNYFRLTPDNRLLFGGKARFAAVSNQKTDVSSGALLREQLAATFPSLAKVEIDYCWGGLVGVTQDHYPRAGRADDVIFGMGYSGHGAQMSTLIGSALADLALGQEDTNPLKDLEWKAVPSLNGMPWFLPIVGAYYRLKDRLA